MLTRETFVGPWAGLPVAWSDHDEFDEQTYRADIARCCEAGVPGIYTSGTTGEFYAMEFDEFKTVTRAAIEEARAHGVAAMVGCTSTYTLGAVRRAAVAAELGADAVQLALPFWMEIGDGQIVPFFEEVAAAAEGLAISIYETKRAKKVLTLEQHRAIKEAVPRYLMVKSNRGTIASAPHGCSLVSQFINVFVGENRWQELCPAGAVGCCSSYVYWNPGLILSAWEHVRQKDWQGLEVAMRPFDELGEFMNAQFDPKGYTDTAYDRLGGIAGGFIKASLRCRGPYPSVSEEDVRTLRRWCEQNFPQMLH